MEWNDLELVLAVAEHGGLIGGARALDVHPTTVSRRLKQLEASRTVQLFEKMRHGVVLTPAGADVVDVAQKVRDMTHDLSARLEGRNTSLSGVIRLTTVDTLLEHWMPDFAQFTQRFPEIELELTSGLAMANLTDRDADVAVRIADRVPEHLIGARLCRVAHAVYANDHFVEAHRGGQALTSLPWVSYDLAVFRGMDDYLARAFPDVRIALRVQRIDLLMSALEAGVGIGVLQCLAGDSNPKLRRLESNHGDSDLWVLTHPQLRGAARISTFMSFLRGLVARDADLFEGRRAPSLPS